MADEIKGFFDSIFGKLPVGQRLKIIIVALILFGGGISLIFFARRPKLILLYSNLAVEDANAISSELSNQKVPFKISQDGGSVFVPEGDVHKVRLQLASKGLPQGGGVGFEIFDRTNLGMTDFMQQVNYRRALQGELARTISQLIEVEQARVHIAIPERSLFIEEDNKEPTASITLKLRNVTELRREQVKGIVHLVASSVEGLLPENITVIDIHGRLLSKGKEEDTVGKLTSTQWEYQREFEHSLEKRVESMLEKIVGQGKVIARISVTLDYKKIEQTEEIYLPDTVVRSEQRSSQQSSDSQPTASGIPGIVSNVPGAGETGIAGSTPSSKNESATGQESETINYEVSKTIRHTIEPLGNIKNLSVAVIVDYKIDDNDKKKYDEEMQKLTSIVKSAVGYNEKRGDDINVENMPIETNSISSEELKVWDLEEKKHKQRELIITVAKYAGISLLILFAIFFISKLARDSMVEPRKGFTYMGGGEEGAPAGGGTLPPSSVRTGKTVEEIEREIEAKMEAELEANPEAMKGVVLKKKILDMVRKDPKTVTQLIRSWISEVTR
ncbi:MAG: flagellar basal-body MS-ring/collar protein FliF [bacterium]